MPELSVMEAAECYCQVAEFLFHIFFHEFHASNTLLNNAGYTKARKEYFSFLAEKSCWGTATVIYHLQPSL
jgi:hypothetical protein